MEEGDALEFYEEVIGGEEGPHAAPDKKKEFVLEAANGRELTVELVPADRKFVIDQLSNLPEDLLEMFSEVDDPEELDENEATSALTGLSGDAIESFENLCSEGMQHGELTQHHFDELVTQLDLEVLFEMGSHVIELSLEDDGKITGFRERS